jgi:hypothetical protein
MALHMDILVDDHEVKRAVAALEETLTGQHLLLFHQTATEPIIRRRARTRFANEGDSAVGSWAPLRESTEDIREHAGFPRAHPINQREGDLERLITRGANEFTAGGDWAAFFNPGRSMTRKQRDSLRTAQGGRPAGHPMPKGWRPNNGTKPSPSATPPRPVVGLDAVDLAHTMSALQIWVAGEVGKMM